MPSRRGDQVGRWASGAHRRPAAAGIRRPGGLRAGLPVPESGTSPGLRLSPWPCGGGAASRPDGGPRSTSTELGRVLDALAGLRPSWRASADAAACHFGQDPGYQRPAAGARPPALRAEQGAPARSWAVPWGRSGGPAAGACPPALRAAR